MVNKLDKYGNVDDHVEPLDDGIYYRVDDVDEHIIYLESVIDRTQHQFNEMADIAERAIEL